MEDVGFLRRFTEKKPSITARFVVSVSTVSVSLCCPSSSPLPSYVVASPACALLLVRSDSTRRLCGTMGLR